MNSIGGVVVSVLALIVEDRAFYARHHQGRIQDFKLGRTHLKKLRPAERDAKIFGVFRVKKSRFYAKKSYFFQF
jgi:hypothetical protein